ncbi:MAG TPA: sugar porter family MFS transporter [Verrucomicrobiales bacterium]|nr:sugar porter family MFS transporter [Verrucomicrobiales bacterium]
MAASVPSSPPLPSDAPPRITAALIGATLVGALGGLLFGFDTAVISGCQDDLVKLFTLTKGEQGFMTASAMIGATLGSLGAAKPGDRYGRRDCLKVVAAFYLLCALGCAFANGLTLMVASRILGGLAVGATSVLGPMYLAEIAPAAWRGRLVACFQVNIVIGVLVAYGSNYLISRLDMGAAEWRWKLGVQSIPAFLFLVLLFFIPRSPRWLMMKNRRDEALSVLQTLGVKDAETQIGAIERSLRDEAADGTAPLFTRSHARPVMLAIIVAMFNQLGGINALWYYADQIFAMAGFDKNASGMQSVILGSVNLLATLAGMAIIDKVGRKPLLIWGSAGGAISLGLVTWIFSSNVHADWLVWLLGGMVICHAFGQGAVIWVFISEIFPTAVRSKGQTLGSFTHWFMAMVISWVFPLVAKDLGQPGAGLPFAFFALMMVVQIFVVTILFPETKRVSLEEMNRRLETR